MTLQDRPTAAELTEAVREFLERDVMPAVEGRMAFHARVAANALGMVARELESGPGLDAEERARLAELLGHDGTIDELTAELARCIRDGSLDSRRDEVMDAVRETIRAKLVVANPGYLNR
ncbi:MAG: DUF6285 domain-containing protein [Acidimicrobiia bacterium]